MAIINVGPTRVLKTINSAYAQAVSGDILLIDEGLYEEKFLMTNTKVHLIGNTTHPERGKVILQQKLTDDYLLNFSGITSTTIRIEGINLIWSPNDAADGYDHPIEIYQCWGSTIVFNRCTIDGSFYWNYIFDSSLDDLYKIGLYNCRLNWKPIDDWSLNGLGHFEQNGAVIYDVRKCVLTNIIENGAQNNPRIPFGIPTSLANNTNTTSDLSNVNNMFTVTDSYASRNDCVIGQQYFIYVDLDSPKVVSKWAIDAYNYWIGNIYLYGSNDDLKVSWDLLSTFVSDNTFYPTPMRLGVMTHNTAYKYYRVGIVAGNATMMVQSFMLLEKGNDHLYYDYVNLPGKIEYGPAYGSYITDLPDQYYFKGEVRDTVLDNVMIDTVTFNPFDKSVNVSLSNNNHRATVSTSNKYADYCVRATVGRKTGKWYWEFSSSSTYGNCRVGLGTNQASLDQALGSDSFGWGYEYSTGNIYRNGVVVLNGPPSDNDDIIGIAYDAYNGKIWFSRNGEWMFDGNPSTGLNPAIEVSATLFPMTSLNSSALLASVVDFYTDVTDLTYDIPQGFSFYGTKIIWKLKAISADSNELMGITYSDPVDGAYKLFTTYSGAHFLICEDAAEEPIYNDLLLGRLIPEVISL